MPVEIIAEIGVNHNLDLGVAFELIDAAKEAGADVAKFQASIPENEVAARYAPEHLAFVRGLIPSFAFLSQCKQHCEAAGIEFLCTPADEESVKRLVDMGVKRLKIGSDNLTNPFVLDAARVSGLPVILSTGMANNSEIRAALAIFSADPGRVSLLHCTSAYPCPASDANLLAIANLREWFCSGYRGERPMARNVGWSDHTQSITLPAVAVGLGAEIIEKHITLDRDMAGPDHKASAVPALFARMVAHVREAEEALGSGTKMVMPSEQDGVTLFRKSLIAKRPIKKGDRFSSYNLTAMRPGHGLDPSKVIALWSRLASRDYDEGEMIDRAED